MTTKFHRKYYEILEVQPDSSWPEIKRSYHHLRELYSSESMATLPVGDEFLESVKTQILLEIEEAYSALLALHERRGWHGAHQPKTWSNFEDDADKTSSDDILFRGTTLRQIRQALGIELCDIARSTKIGKEHLLNVEQERFEALPPEVYLRGFLAAYAKHLSLNAKKVIDDYMMAYHQWIQEGGTRS